MCGIAGILSSESKKDYSFELQKMLDSIQHRGPDGQGTAHLNHVHLGHRRLSIVDLEGGKQPMFSHSNINVITFNGEIYDYQNVKKKYSYPYQNHSDTELILAMYEKYGKDLLSRLPGMFAFALWDASEHQLFCARDRFGEKPFFYATTPEGEFIFGSEIKALLASGLIYPRFSRSSIAYFLNKGFIHPHFTIYDNIHVLPPGHFLTCKPGQKPEIRKYWDLPEKKESFDFENACHEFADLFDKAVAKQLVADVKVSAFLSGGLDSSSVVMRALRHQPNLRPISFEFEEDSELHFAEELAKHLDFPLDVIKSGQINVSEELNEILTKFDEPFADSSIVPTYLICKKAVAHTKVALTGDGADELLGGYDYWYANIEAIREGRIKGIPMAERTKHFVKMLLNASIRKGNYDSQLAHQSFLHHGIKSKHLDLATIHNQQYSFLSPEKAEDILLDKITWRSAMYESYESDAALRHDLLHYLPGDILVKSDRCSMACGLELRAPFLDKDLAEFCLSLPYEFKRWKGKSKRILRATMEKEWPEILRNRPKQGFSISYEQWMKEPGIQALWQNLILSNFSILEWVGLIPDKIKTANFSAKEKWNLLSLALWAEKRTKAHGSN